MKLRKLLSLSIAAILLCFTGCVNKNTLSKHEPITILAPYLECDRLVDLVHKKYPEINLKVLSYSGANTTTYLQNMLAADDLPDICTQTIYDPNIDDVSDRMIDLAGYDFTDNYVESRLQDISDDGAIYMLPSAYSCIGITYNKTLLEKHGWKLPKSFHDLEKLAKKAKKAGVQLCLTQIEYPGYGFQYMCNIADTAFLGTFQGKQWQKDYLTGKANVSDTKKMMDCMDYIQKWKDLGMFTANKKNPQSDDETIKEFMKGNTLFLLGSKNGIGVDRWIFGLSIGILVITAVLFVLFGRDEKIIPSIQYQPPQGMDSAVVGYVVDGSVDDKDVISLILYWADKGYLKMKEKGQKDMEFIKLKDIPDSEPRYQKTMFEALFKNRKKVKASSLQYKFADTVQVVKDDIKYDYKKNIYATSSKVARIVSFVLLQLPICLFAFIMMIFSPDGILNLILPLMAWVLYFIGMFLACHSVDKWYAISKGARTGLPIASAVLSILGFIFYGLYYYVKIQRGELFDFFHVYLVIVAVSFIGVILTAFMKKRTHQCVEWMGYLAGLRDFIETAELDRMKVLAKDHPDMFYHILPYSMVFGLFDLYAKKLDALKLPAPDWYVYGGSDPYFHYYMMGHYMDHVVSENLTVVEPSESGGVGEFFSGGDGGFSGGGFGGGGGGSW